MLSKAFLLAAVLSPALGAVLERLATTPRGWTASTPSADTTMSLTIGLTQQNIDQLEAKLAAVSTPGHADFGKHMDMDEVNALFAPTTAADEAVQSWLKSAGISSLHSDGHWISFTTTVEQANLLLNTTFRAYTNSGVSKIRTTHYSVPDSVAPHIDLITPTTYFGKVSAEPARFAKIKREAIPRRTKTTRRATSAQVAASCQTSITPSCLKQLYNIGNYTPSASSGSRVGFGSFLNESALYTDTFQYEKFFGIPQQNFSVVLLNNATNDQNPETASIGEANLDVQNIIGIAHPLPVTEFITGGSPPFVPSLDIPTAAENTNEPYLPYYQYLLSQPNSAIPQVISNSYGDPEATVPKSYAIRVCNMIGILGLRGVSVLESSGDTGVGAGCKTNDGTNSTTFGPQFPGTCPYIISVGGTQAVTPEIAWTDGSGGFSNYFETAFYQQAAVDTYLDKYITPETKKYYEPYTNFIGRGFPDISAHSLTPNYQIVYDGLLGDSGGTSAAAPVVAGILALLNDARFKAGKSSVGFINPVLYLMGADRLNDITGGGSVGCNGVNGQTGARIPGGGIVPYASWNATVGWDPVTGLGTPDFQKLLSLYLELP